MCAHRQMFSMHALLIMVTTKCYKHALPKAKSTACGTNSQHWSHRTRRANVREPAPAPRRSARSDEAAAGDAKHSVADQPVDDDGSDEQPRYLSQERTCSR